LVCDLGSVSVEATDRLFQNFMCNACEYCSTFTTTVQSRLQMS
jgi:hypothetical protein